MILVRENSEVVIIYPDIYIHYIYIIYIYMYIYYGILWDVNGFEWVLTSKTIEIYRNIVWDI